VIVAFLVAYVKQHFSATQISTAMVEVVFVFMTGVEVREIF